MAKATLEFNLPEDEVPFIYARQSENMADFIFKIREHLFNSCLDEDKFYELALDYDFPKEVL